MHHLISVLKKYFFFQRKKTDKINAHFLSIFVTLSWHVTTIKFSGENVIDVSILKGDKAIYNRIISQDRLWLAITM